MLSTNYTCDLNFAFDVFKILQEDELSYFYRGSFSQKIAESLISLTETNLDKTEEPTKIKKKVYFIMVESLQNIVKHQDEEAIDKDRRNLGIFTIQKIGPKYYITTGNRLHTQSVKSLEKKLTKINSLEPTELKQYYLTMLKEGQISEKGGAGLGLIDIAKKSGNKLAYDFNEIDEACSYFYLQTSINSQAPVNGDQFEVKNDSLPHVKSIHEVLNNQNIKLIFKGSINQDTLLSLLAVIQGQLGATVGQKRIVSIIIEMIQNIVKHGYRQFEDNADNSGIFIIREKENEEFCIVTGNYIENCFVDTLKNQVLTINEMSHPDLKAKYNKALFSQDNKFKSNAGLGLMKLKLKSKSKIGFDLNKINENFSFLTFQVNI